MVGASATRMNNGNVVVVNLRAAGFAGGVYPVHATAEAVEGYAAVRGVGALPEVDLGVVSVPAAGVLEVLQGLEAAGVRAAIVMSSGFSEAETEAVRGVCGGESDAGAGAELHGVAEPDGWDSLYTAIPSARVVPGRAALVAQSGSAAISVMNSTDVGFSKVITSGSQFRLTAADFLEWLAEDAATAVVGLVVESIPDPDRFADAVDRAQASGTAVVMLKVGQSALGGGCDAGAYGALISNRDAVDAYARRYRVPMVRDYDELVAALECFAAVRGRPVRNRIAIAGISGGEAALTCDIAEGWGWGLRILRRRRPSGCGRCCRGRMGSIRLISGRRWRRWGRGRRRRRWT